MKAHVLARAAGPGTRLVTTGCRPGGRSRTAVTSRSPNCVRARLRGIGVAVITSTCGSPSPALNAARWATPELVLLIHHRHPQPREVHAFLDQGLGADDQFHRAGFDACPQVLPPFVGVSRPVNNCRSTRLCRRAVWTVCQCWLARTSVGAISAACLPWATAVSMAYRANDRLAGADVRLQQAVHGGLAGEVGGDLFDGVVLAAGELEREQPADAGVDLGAHRQRRGPPAAPPQPPPQGDAELELEQVVEQAPAGGPR